MQHVTAHPIQHLATEFRVVVTTNVPAWAQLAVTISIAPVVIVRLMTAVRELVVELAQVAIQVIQNVLQGLIATTPEHQAIILFVVVKVLHAQIVAFALIR